MIRLLITSDVHGYLTPFRYSDCSLSDGGLARLSPLIQQYRTENSLLIDNGDALQGSPLLYWHHKFESGTMNPMAKVYNYLGYDYLNTGNHDFNFGYQNQLNFYRDCKATVLTGNIRYDHQPVRHPYQIHTFPSGIRIALIGCVTQHIPNWERPENISHLTFKDAFTFMQETVAQVQKEEHPDYIIGIYHGGIERDLTTGEATELLNGENEGYAMCTEIPGLDLLITGHQHRSLTGMIHGVPVVQCAANAREMALIELDGKTIRTELLRPDDGYDNNILQLIETEETATQHWLDQPLGTVLEGDLLLQDMFLARLEKHPLVSFLNQVQMAYGEADIAFTSLANEVTGFRHEITMRDIVSTYVYPNTMMVLELSGATLKEMLEHSAEYFAVVDGKIGINPMFAAPKPQHYNYEMADGLSYTIRVSKPVGQRIEALTYHHQPVDPHQLYHAVMSNYRASGGGDYDMLKGCKVVKEIQRDMVECIAEYVQSHPQLQIEHTQNIQVIL